MSGRLVIQLGMFALAVTVAALTVLGSLSSNSPPKSVWSLETLLDHTDKTSIPEESQSESGSIDSLSPISSFYSPHYQNFHQDYIPHWHFSSHFAVSTVAHK